MVAQSETGPLRMRTCICEVKNVHGVHVRWNALEKNRTKRDMAGVLWHFRGCAVEIVFVSGFEGDVWHVNVSDPLM